MTDYLNIMQIRNICIRKMSLIHANRMAEKYAPALVGPDPEQFTEQEIETIVHYLNMYEALNDEYYLMKELYRDCIPAKTIL